MNGPFDGAVLDRSMPGTPALESIRRVNSRFPKRSLLPSRGSGQSESIPNLQPGEGMGFPTKPSSLRHLARRVQAAPC